MAVVVVTLGLAFVCGLIFRLRFRITVSWRKRVMTTLHNLYWPYFLPEVMMKFTIKASGRFVTLIKIEHASNGPLS